MFFCGYSLAQSHFIVQGRVTDSSDNNLTDVIISTTVKNTMLYAVTDREGKFMLRVDQHDTASFLTIVLSVKLIGFAEKELQFTISKKVTILPPILLQSKIINLSEVIVQNKPIVQKGDTTIFTVSAFNNKLDVNLEDVLKKMPGMDVDESGNIRYNNKAIENIMIEGDVLSKNYKLISKNITPDMVDKVEMIDKYSANPVLKDLTNSQKQTMNLVLKNPKKLKKFGTLKLGAGVEERYNATGSLFVLNNKIKTMSIINKNNIGISPYSDYSVDQEFSKTSDYEFIPTILPNYITENTLFTQSFFGNNTNSLFNKSNLGVLNSSIRLNKHTSIKLFSDGYADQINQYQQTTNQNNLYPLLSYDENLTKRFLPRNFNNNAEIKWQSKKSQLLFAVSYISKNYTEYNDVLTLINFNSTLRSNYKRLAGALYYTHRIDSLRAFEISYQNTRDKKSQDFALAQSSYRLLDSVYLTNYQVQQTDNNIASHVAEIKYLFKKRRTNQISLKNNYFHSSFNAGLTLKDNNGDNLKVPGYTDTTTIENNDLVLNYNTGVKFRKLSVIADMGLLLNSFIGISGAALKTTNNQLYATPKIRLIYLLANHQQLSINGGWEVDNATLANTYQNPLLIGYRTIKRNAGIPLPINSLRYGINYSYTNINTATSLLFSYQHAAQMQSEINNYSFTADFNYYNTRYASLIQKFDNVYFKFDKYIYPLKTAIGIKHSLIWFSNPTEVQGIITSSRFFSYNANLSIRPTIQKDVNFNFGMDYKYNKDISSAKSTFQLNPYFDVLISAGKKFSFGGRCNYFYNNYLEQKRKYVFANLYAWYNIIPKKLDAKFSMFNLLNTNATYSGTATTALSKAVNTQLLPRYGLVEFVYKF